MEIKDVVSLLKSEMIPAMGCTEPAASALAGAKARELIGDDRIKGIAVFASRDIVKNAMGVGIPDCERWELRREILPRTSISFQT